MAKKASTRELLRTAGTGKDARNFLYGVMGNEDLPMEMRIDAAKTLMPYQYAKLPTKGSEKALQQLAGILVQYV